MRAYVPVFNEAAWNQAYDMQEIAEGDEEDEVDEEQSGDEQRSGSERDEDEDEERDEDDDEDGGEHRKGESGDYSLASAIAQAQRYASGGSGGGGGGVDAAAQFRVVKRASGAHQLVDTLKGQFEHGAAADNAAGGAGTPPLKGPDSPRSLSLTLPRRKAVAEPRAGLKAEAVAAVLSTAYGPNAEPLAGPAKSSSTSSVASTTTPIKPDSVHSEARRSGPLDALIRRFQPPASATPETRPRGTSGASSRPASGSSAGAGAGTAAAAGSSYGSQFRAQRTGSNANGAATPATGHSAGAAATTTTHPAPTGAKPGIASATRCWFLRV